MPTPTYEQDLLALQMDRVNSDRHWNDVVVPTIRAHEWDPTPAPDLELVTIRAARFMRLNWPAQRNQMLNAAASLTFGRWATEQRLAAGDAPPISLPVVPPKVKRQTKRRRR